MTIETFQVKPQTSTLWWCWEKSPGVAEVSSLNPVGFTPRYAKYKRTPYNAAYKALTDWRAATISILGSLLFVCKSQTSFLTCHVWSQIVSFNLRAARASGSVCCLRRCSLLKEECCSCCCPPPTSISGRV